ncbi:hypothetical protein DM01DRAFT_1031097 [Hesseltinella vesiculosa]|uniref:Tc1-like transposase DDE domain-containing protein n=1 Tax=Hesseltinella vesiculosa TaxID=101127 RepID=A0A1X2GJB8_9FUNG|nr:hypothetical protein DM01DRAFT_1031097 [Hesseltinella vesiculosa]
MRKQHGGRKPILNENHKAYLIALFDDNSTATIDEATDGLTKDFVGLEIKRSAVSNFLKHEMKMAFKKVELHAEARDSPEAIEARYEWVKHMQEETNMDYLSNCIFIDEAAFSIHLHRSSGWSKKGTTPVVSVRTTNSSFHSQALALRNYPIIGFGFLS